MSHFKLQSTLLNFKRKSSKIVPMLELKKVKAVGLISGGLDSTITAQVIQDLGVEIHGVYFAMPWGCCDKGKAQSAADKLNIPLVVLQLDERYLDIVKNPQYGYGSALNPCVDCRIHMFTRAAQYMRSINADFVFTGEVLGQRPMSQLRHSMKWIEEGSGLQGRLVRPLCAQLLDPTIPEQEGLIDRAKLLNLSGRSRKEQIRMAEEHQITDYPAPAGGCLLTDRNFARRMKDVFQHGYRNFRETVALKWGRHFRIDENFKFILGRNDEENQALKSYAHTDDHILELKDKKGPTMIVKGSNPNPEILAMAAGIVQHFSRYKDAAPMELEYWPVSDKNKIQNIQAVIMTEQTLQRLAV